MLLWQLKKHKKLSILGQLFCCIGLVHLLILLLFFIVKSPKKVFFLHIQKNPVARNLPVIFVPSKDIRQSTGQSVIVQKKEQPKKIEPKKEISIKPKVQEKKQTVVATNKNEKKTAPIQNKNVVAKKDVVNAKKEQVPPNPKKETLVEKKQEAVIAPQEKSQQALTQAAPEAMYVSATEIEQLTLQNFIQQEIGVHWRPPQSLAGQLQCNVKLSVNADGSIKEAAIVQSSGVLIYDLAAESALLKISCFPAWARSKEFIITFNQ